MTESRHVDTGVPSRQRYFSLLVRSLCLSFADLTNFMFKGSDNGWSVAERKDTTLIETTATETFS